VTINHTLANAGSAAAGAGRVGYYLSTDATITAADTLLGASSFSAVAANGSVGLSGTVTLPDNLPDGTYYIGVIGDYTDAVEETSNANNASQGVAIAVAGPPIIDLSEHVTSVSTASVGAGGSVTVNHTLSNLGSSASGAGNVGYFLSSDSTIT